MKLQEYLAYFGLNQLTILEFQKEQSGELVNLRKQGKPHPEIEKELRAAFVQRQKDIPVGGLDLWGTMQELLSELKEENIEVSGIEELQPDPPTTPTKPEQVIPLETPLYQEFSKNLATFIYNIGMLYALPPLPPGKKILIFDFDETITKEHTYKNSKFHRSLDPQGIQSNIRDFDKLKALVQKIEKDGHYFAVSSFSDIHLDTTEKYQATKGGEPVVQERPVKRGYPLILEYLKQLGVQTPIIQSYKTYNEVGVNVNRTAWEGKQEHFKNICGVTGASYESIIFVDDDWLNVQAALQRGIKAFWFNGQNFQQLLDITSRALDVPAVLLEFFPKDQTWGLLSKEIFQRQQEFSQKFAQVKSYDDYRALIKPHFYYLPQEFILNFLGFLFKQPGPKLDIIEDVIASLIKQFGKNGIPGLWNGVLIQLKNSIPKDQSQNQEVQIKFSTLLINLLDYFLNKAKEIKAFPGILKDVLDIPLQRSSGMSFFLSQQESNHYILLYNEVLNKIIHKKDEKDVEEAYYTIVSKFGYGSSQEMNFSSKLELNAIPFKPNLQLLLERAIVNNKISEIQALLKNTAQLTDDMIKKHILKSESINSSTLDQLLPYLIENGRFPVKALKYLGDQHYPNVLERLFYWVENHSERLEFSYLKNSVFNLYKEAFDSIYSIAILRVLNALGVPLTYLESGQRDALTELIKKCEVLNPAGEDNKFLNEENASENSSENAKFLKRLLLLTNNKDSSVSHNFSDNVVEKFTAAVAANDIISVHNLLSQKEVAIKDFLAIEVSAPQLLSQSCQHGNFIMLKWLLEAGLKERLTDDFLLALISKIVFNPSNYQLKPYPNWQKTLSDYLLTELFKAMPTQGMGDANACFESLKKIWEEDPEIFEKYSKQWQSLKLNAPDYAGLFKENPGLAQLFTKIPEQKENNEKSDSPALKRR